MTTIAPAVHVRTAGRQVLVSRPDDSSAGRLSVDTLEAFARARASGSAACLLRGRSVSNDALFAIRPDDVAVVQAVGATGVWLRASWWAKAAAHRATERIRAGTASVWREIHLELRHHAGDERLPSALRTRLRELAKEYFARSIARRPGPRNYPRRLLRERVKTSLPAPVEEEARAAARALGVAVDAPVVTYELGPRPEVAADARSFLVQQGYTVVCVGEADYRIRQPGVIHLAGSPHGSPTLELFLLLISRFVVCESTDLQQLAYLTNTPSLTVNASDPFRAYPIRNDGLYTLRKVIDLDTGSVLATTELLSERYFRDLRNLGYRDNTPAEVVEAVREMHDGVCHGWHESPSQARFRRHVTEAGVELAAKVPYVAEWGPDRGFVGDGRLVRYQSDEAQ